MASMALQMPYVDKFQFDAVEKKVERLDAGLTFAQEMSLFIRFFFAAVHITGVLQSTVAVQKSLIDELSAPRVQELPPSRLASLAAKIEHLVKLNEHALKTAPELEVRFWGGYLEQLQEQAEHLESIAETFRMACDDEALGILASIAKDITLGSSEQFVGAVHA